MGQKVNPNSLRFGINKNWVSRWNAPDKKTRVKWIFDDERIRFLIKKTFRECGIGCIEIERFLNVDETVSIDIYIHVSQIGLFTSQEKKVSELNRSLRRFLGKTTKTNLIPVSLENPSVSAELIGQEIVDIIQSRAPHRFLVKRIIRRTMTSGAEGIKIIISGRINGIEIARSESYVDGSVPLSTLRADIDYSFQIAKTTYGIIGIKVWVNRGLYFGKNFMPFPSSPKNLVKKNLVKDNKYISTTY